MAQKEISTFSSAQIESIHLVPNDSIKIAEDEIWQQFKNGDEKAFIWIYKTYFPILYNYARQFGLDPGFIKDQIQELYIYIRNNRKQLADVKSIKFYLFKSLRRRLISGRKKSFSFISLLLPEDRKHFNIEFTISSEVKLINQQLDEEICKHLTKSINKLTSRQKEAVTHFYYEGMSYQEVAEIMSFQKVKSVRKLIYRAIDALRKDLKGLKSKLYN